MADFSVSDVASRVKGPEGMSLADMMNMAIGAQTFKQREKINPLLERQQSAVTTEAEETLQPKIARTKAESQRSVYEADKAGVDLKQHYVNIGRGLFGGFLTDPDFINGNADKMISKIEGAKSYAETVLGVPKDILSNSDRIVDMIRKNPSDGYQYIKNGVLQSGQNQAQTNLVTPSVQNINNVPYSYTAAGNVATPLGVNPNQPQVQPNAPMVQPQQTVTPADMNKPAYSQKAPLPYPTRAAGQPYAPAPTEKADQDFGVAYKNSLIGRQSTLTTDRRNIDEVLKVATELEKSSLPTSGIAGAVRRKVATWAGDPTYTQLSKDLANTTLTNLKTLGLSTDADKNLISAANGDFTYPPEVLKNIAKRAKADMTNIDMQANAANKFSQAYGDNNMNAFKQMWAKNADSKIFELYNVFNDPNLSKKEKEKARDSLLPKGAKERKMFQEKWNNIKKLEETGSL
jgi:hypothetical protein